jgi:predicted alpha-1,2-mannosidase
VRHRGLFVVLILGLSPYFLGQANSPETTALVDIVDPNIGGIGILLQPTLPLVQLPYGMVRIAPLTDPGFQDRYVAPKIFGFPAAGASFIPVVGSVAPSSTGNASDYDHDLETVKPYYCSEFLDRYGLQVEYTVAQRAAYYRIDFRDRNDAHIVFNVGANGEISARSATVVVGSAEQEDTRSYFYVTFSQPMVAVQQWPGTDEAEHGLRVDLKSPLQTPLELKVGISYISVEEAQKNLDADLGNSSFADVKNAARQVWNELSKISVTGGTDKQRRIFYTALYRSLNRMSNITEADGAYWGFDGKPHAAGAHPFYTDDGIWDTYRSLHPLQLLIDPSRQIDMITSYLRMYEQTGWMPSFPTVGKERAFMIGKHADELILDTYAKGYRDFNVEEAYEAIRKNAMEATMLPWRRGPATALDRVYFEKGFFPALRVGEKETVQQVHPSERRQAVSVTLESAYDDWAVAELARRLGKKDDQALFGRRALDYRNLYNSQNGFMSPRSLDGAWVEPFDPKLGGGQGGRDYFTECNSWTYSFHVQHDVAGLIQLMGGRERFTQRLDQLFEEPFGKSKFDYLKQFPDCTGGMGQYAQGNEPSFHISYLYAYAGKAWKTQQRVRQIMDLWYDDTPLGIPGDDDGGAMSSWYVFSAMGFYPVTPGIPIYVLGSPIFTKTTIDVGGGKHFTIEAVGASRRNKYIQSASLDGHRLNKPWIEHSDIVGGATLVLEMGPFPNEHWGSAPEGAPPSFSTVTTAGRE